MYLYLVDICDFLGKVVRRYCLPLNHTNMKDKESEGEIL